MMTLLSRSSCWIFYDKAVSLIAAFQFSRCSSKVTVCTELGISSYVWTAVSTSCYRAIQKHSPNLLQPSTDATKTFTSSSSLFFWVWTITTCSRIILIILDYFQACTHSAFKLKAQMPWFLIFSFQKLQPSFKDYQFILILSNSILLYSFPVERRQQVFKNIEWKCKCQQWQSSDCTSMAHLPHEFSELHSKNKSSKATERIVQFIIDQVCQ